MAPPGRELERVARFEAKKGGPQGIGEEPPALWTFSPARKSLQNANRWAQQLSELEPLYGPVPARRLTAVSDRPFDFETDADAAARTATAQRQVVQLRPLQRKRNPTASWTCCAPDGASGLAWTEGEFPTTPWRCS